MILYPRQPFLIEETALNHRIPNTELTRHNVSITLFMHTLGRQRSSSVAFFSTYSMESA